MKMLKVYAVFDVKSAAYGNPIFLPSNGIALRTFGEACLNPESPMFKYPEDFSLFEIGMYDPSSGELKAVSKPTFVVSAAAIRAGVAQPKPVAQEALKIIGAKKVSNAPKKVTA